MSDELQLCPKCGERPAGWRYHLDHMCGCHPEMDLVCEDCYRRECSMRKYHIVGISCQLPRAKIRRG